MRYAKLTRRLSFVAVVLLGLAVAGDIVALQVAESKAAAGFAQATAAEKVTIDLGGFPFLPGLFTGRISRVEIRARGMSGAGMRVAEFVASASDVRFSPGGAVSVIRSQHAPRTKVVVHDPSGRVEVTQTDLEDFAKRREPLVHDVRITPTGIEVRFAPATDVVSPPARFLPRIDRTSNKLILQFRGMSGLPRELNHLVERAKGLERAIDLPPVPEGLSTPDLQLGNGAFAIEAAGRRIELLVGEGGLRSA